VTRTFLDRTSRLALVLAFVAAGGLVAEAEEKKQPNNPVGAGGWDSEVKSGGRTSRRTLSTAQMKSIDTVNRYFNNLQNLKGRFTQTNPDGKIQRGKFHLKRPGKFRFDYRRPSRQIIVSDGKLLAIQDLDLKNEDVYGLENTPFRILLRDKVDLLGDANILAVEQSETQVAVTIADKDPDAAGQITIYLSNTETPELAGWVTNDVQGGVTKVKISDISRPEQLDPRLFEREKLYLKSIQ